MSFFDNPPLHDFPDRAIRLLQAHPEHLRQLVHQVLPQLADRFAFDRARPLERAFPMPDWRRREADLLFDVPFREADTEAEALVCVLVEHQSAPDPSMPLRTLLYAVLYWERQWRAWEERHRRGEPLRLGPVVPIVLHTGPDPWETNRTLADLVVAPAALRPFVPAWQPLFWDLPTKAPEDLLRAAGQWLQALAVVRAEGTEAAAFAEVFAGVLERLAPLSGQDRLRWQDLMWFVTSWAVRRRPRQERDELFTAALGRVQEAALRQEIQTMAQQVAQTWEQELLARGEARGEARGKAEGQLEASKSILRGILEDHFGALPEALLQQIDSIQEVARLQAAARRAARIQSLEELQL